MAMEIDTDNADVQIKFMHPHLPSTSFKWPVGDDVCWVPKPNVLHITNAPILQTLTGRNYQLEKYDIGPFQKINVLFKRTDKPSTYPCPSEFLLLNLAFALPISHFKRTASCFMYLQSSDFLSVPVTLDIRISCFRNIEAFYLQISICSE